MNVETFSRVELIGRLGRVPSLRYTPSGRPILQVFVAVGEAGASTWIEVEICDRAAELVAVKARGGSRVKITGRIGVREWTDRRRGGKPIDRRAQIVVAETVEWIEREAPPAQPDPRAGRD